VLITKTNIQFQIIYRPNTVTKSNTMKNFTTHALIFFLLLISVAAKSQSGPKLNSLPTATATILLDFDGQTVTAAGWNAGKTFTVGASNLTDAQITEIFERVSEDYRPFNVNITTDEAKFVAAPLAQRVRIIVTGTSSWYAAGVGGISYIGSFTWGDDTPGFVFADRLSYNTKYVAECCSHEAGHTVGLSHQSTYDSNCKLIQTYNPGSGSGQTGWAPLMGNSYGQNMTGWIDGPTPYGCAATQDNLTIITSQNGFTYRPDDYTDAVDASAYSLGTGSFNVPGIITTSTDKDAFKFVNTNSGNIHLEVTPFGLNTDNSGANLDAQLDLYDGNKNLIRTYNPTDVMNVVADTVLNAGTYYLVVSGAGNANVGNYGSLGSYTLSALKSLLPIHDIALTGVSTDSKHNLNWKIVADEPIKSETLEVSSTGSSFKTLSGINIAANSFSYAPNQSATLYYRLKVTSVTGQVMYSNILALKGTGNNVKAYSVSTFITSDITVNAPDNYQYIINDMNGRILAKGNGIKGVNKINIQNQATGMYVIQLINNNTKQTERIIKQ
jgi:hypothetical protein